MKGGSSLACLALLLCGFHPCSPPTFSGIINVPSTGGASAPGDHTGLYTKSLSQGNAVPPGRLPRALIPPPPITRTPCDPDSGMTSMPSQHCHPGPKTKPCPHAFSKLSHPGPVKSIKINNLNPSKSAQGELSIQTLREYLHFGKR